MTGHQPRNFENIRRTVDCSHESIKGYLLLCSEIDNKEADPATHNSDG